MVSRCFLLLLGFCCLSIGLVYGESDESVVKTMIARVRRQAAQKSSGRSLDPKSQCVIKHLKEIEQKLGKELSPSKNISKAASLAKPHQLFSRADAATLEKFCTIYKASRFQLAACDESEMKRFAAKGLAVVDYLCITRYNDFAKALPCIHNVDMELDDDCRANCSEYESAAAKLNGAGAALIKKYSRDQIKDLFAESCQYVKCYMDCQVPTLKKSCGDTAVELEESAIGITFTNLDELMNQSAAASIWPEQCKPLSAMGKADKKAILTNADSLLRSA